MEGKASEKSDAIAQHTLSLDERRKHLGTELRLAREAAGLSLSALAQSTRINFMYLDCLERGAYEALPGGVFIRGFVKNICKTMGCDSAPFLAQLSECIEPEPEKSCLKIEIKNKPGRYRQTPGESLRQGFTEVLRKIQLPQLKWARLRLPVFLLVGFAGAYGLLRQAPWKSGEKSASHVNTNVSIEETAEHTTAGVVNEPASSAVAASGAAPVEGAPAPNVLAADTVANAQKSTSTENLSLAKEAGTSGDQLLEINATEPVKIRIDIDGAGYKTEQLTAQSYTFKFKDKAELMVYDAAAVQIQFNGRSLGNLGNKGRVRRLSFQAKAPSDKKF